MEMKSLENLWFTDYFKDEAGRSQSIRLNSLNIRSWGRSLIYCIACSFLVKIPKATSLKSCAELNLWV